MDTAKWTLLYTYRKDSQSLSQSGMTVREGIQLLDFVPLSVYLEEQFF